MFLPLVDTVAPGADEGGELVGGVVGGPAFAVGGRAGLELVEVLLEAEADEGLLVGFAEDEVEEEGQVGAGLGGVGDVESDRDALLAVPAWPAA